MIHHTDPDLNPAGPHTPVCSIGLEYTDTFAGEANYSWVKRKNVVMPEKATERQIMKRARAEMGLTGVPGKWENMGGDLAFRPHGSCTVLFVQFLY